ncbi:unnamed protein product [Urochloa decumbens]|uniref:Uncharacterized protein n=1 Tax=Urochloa decumbens TaxID=240449 RepID=A0ABC8Z1E0_9POAL
MRRKSMMTMFLCAVLGSLSMQTQCRPQLLDATRRSIDTAANSTSLYERKNENIFLCPDFKCTYFNPKDLCFCCPDPSRKEYCHLTYSECVANCHIREPKF